MFRERLVITSASSTTSFWDALNTVSKLETYGHILRYTESVVK